MPDYDFIDFFFFTHFENLLFAYLKDGGLSAEGPAAPWLTDQR